MITAILTFYDHCLSFFHPFLSSLFPSTISFKLRTVMNESLVFLWLKSIENFSFASSCHTFTMEMSIQQRLRQFDVVVVVPSGTKSCFRYRYERRKLLLLLLLLSPKGTITCSFSLRSNTGEVASLSPGSSWWKNWIIIIIIIKEDYIIWSGFMFATTPNLMPVAAQYLTAEEGGFFIREWFNSLFPTKIRQAAVEARYLARLMLFACFETTTTSLD